MKTKENFRHTPRLYVEADLVASGTVAIKGDQAHYLRNVMRMKPGDALRIFNGRDGEFLARLGAVMKNAAELAIEKQLRPQQAGADIQLCAAPIKKAHFEYMIEKATELGAAVIQPVLTARTQIREVNTERCRAIAIEAAEQSERLDIPEIRQPVTLKDLIASWSVECIPIICAEMGEAIPVSKAFLAFSNPPLTPALRAYPLPPQGGEGGDPRSGEGEGGVKHLIQKAAVITGPEGGFAEEEFEALRKMPGAVFIRLGPRILRADTAAIAALSLWQALCGDWK